MTIQELKQEAKKHKSSEDFIQSIRLPLMMESMKKELKKLPKSNINPRETLELIEATYKDKGWFNGARELWDSATS